MTLVKPAFEHIPAFHKTYGPEVADLNAMAGFAPDPEQELALNAQFAVDRNDRSVCFETGLIACRQNLKTGWLKQAALGWLFVTDQRLIVWSAHEMRTTAEALRDLVILIEGYAPLRKRLRKVLNANGKESIELNTGQRVLFKARTSGGGRGLTGDRIILDEAYALKPEHMGSLMPTLSARPDPQIVYASSAGHMQSEVLRGIRDRGRLGKSPRLGYLEWAAPENSCATPGCNHSRIEKPEGCALDRVDYWQMANPAMGRRISVDYIRAERDALPEAEFARERLGWWDDPASGDALIDIVAWGKLGDPEAPQPSSAVIAIDVAPDRSWASIGVAGDADGKTLVMCETRRGTAWLAPALVRLQAARDISEVALFGNSQASALIPDLMDAGVDFMKLNAQEMGASCAAFQELINRSEVVHLGQDELTMAVANARTRYRGDGEVEVWDRRDPNGADISPLVACAAAAYRWGITGGTYDVLSSVY